MAKIDFTNKKNPFETQEEQTSNIEIKPNSVHFSFVKQSNF